MTRAAAFGRFAENCLIVVLLTGIIGLASAQIVLRNFFSDSISWADPLIRLAVLWLALLGAIAASRDGRHITMGALTRWLPQRVQAIPGFAAELFAAVVCGVFTWVSVEFVLSSVRYEDQLLNGVPAWPLQTIMPIAFALIGYRYLVRALRRIWGR